ncbi:hypothetical protein KEJ26_00150 [Candidatus Bathyarchaeota archaeon]|nr:hypothetical protein [Candidatus Bathyarchaeota archaeon]
MVFNLIGLALNVIVGVIAVSPVLWLVGRTMVGKEKAKFTDAIWIVTLGIIIGSILGVLVHGFLGFVVSLILWLALIRHFFDTGWLKALAIAVIALVVFAIIVAVLAFIGLLVLPNFV